jgi:hypothetical protein
MLIALRCFSDVGSCRIGDKILRDGAGPIAGHDDALDGGFVSAGGAVESEGCVGIGFEWPLIDELTVETDEKYSQRHLYIHNPQVTLMRPNAHSLLMNMQRRPNT